MATMNTTLSPLRSPERDGHAAPPALAPTLTQRIAAELALAELFPERRAAADVALAELFPALRLRMSRAPVARP
jgi:hypothetical protein